jgi:hypothetical protein
MRIIRAAWVVMAFECRRAMGWSRLLFVLALATFPAALLWLVQHEGGQLHQFVEAWAITLFAMVPGIVCLLGLLLWATPGIHSEVEGKTWPYLVVRPAGKASILLGKYANAVVWSILTGWLALTLCMLVCRPQDRADDRTQQASWGQPQPIMNRALGGASAAQAPEVRNVREEVLLAYKVLAALVALSCISYGALFVLMGVIFLRRAMMIAVAYTALEFGLRIVPSAARELTVQYHLQTLLVRWMGWKVDPRAKEMFNYFFGNSTPWHHVVVLCVYAAVLFGVAAVILRLRELVSVAET